MCFLVPWWPSEYHGTGFPSWSKAKMRDELTGKRRFQEEEIPESVTATETRHVDWRLSMAPLHVWLYTSHFVDDVCLLVISVDIVDIAAFFMVLVFLAWYIASVIPSCSPHWFEALKSAGRYAMYIQWSNDHRSLFSFEHLKEILGKYIMNILDSQSEAAFVVPQGVWLFWAELVAAGIIIYIIRFRSVKLQLLVLQFHWFHCNVLHI